MLDHVVVEWPPAQNLADREPAMQVTGSLRTLAPGSGSARTLTTTTSQASSSLGWAPGCPTFTPLKQRASWLESSHWALPMTSQQPGCAPAGGSASWTRLTSKIWALGRCQGVLMWGPNLCSIQGEPETRCSFPRGGSDQAQQATNKDWGKCPYLPGEQTPGA